VETVSELGPALVVVNKGGEHLWGGGGWVCPAGTHSLRIEGGGEDGVGLSLPHGEGRPTWGSVPARPPGAPKKKTGVLNPIVHPNQSPKAIHARTMVITRFQEDNGTTGVWISGVTFYPVFQAVPGG